MSPSLKNLLGLAVIASLVGFLYFGFVVTRTYDRSSEPTNFRSFTVSAEGKSSAAPDIATFSFQVISEGDDVAELQSENAKKMNATIDALKKQGIEAKDIKTEYYSVSPRYETIVCDYTPGKACPPANIAGYTVQQSVTVKVRDFSKTSTLLSSVVDNGVNAVSAIQFSIDNPTEVENAARAEAIEKAKEKAKNIAEAGGFTLGRLLEISEGSSYTPPYYARGAMMDTAVGSKEAAVAPTIEAGSEEVHITVSLKYEIR